jgi:hypothetical protein
MQVVFIFHLVLIQFRLIFKHEFSIFGAIFTLKPQIVTWHFDTIRLLLSKEINTNVQKTQCDYFLEYH